MVRGKNPQSTTGNAVRYLNNPVTCTVFIIMPSETTKSQTVIRGGPRKLALENAEGNLEPVPPRSVTGDSKNGSDKLAKMKRKIRGSGVVGSAEAINSSGDNSKGDRQVPDSTEATATGTGSGLMTIEIVDNDIAVNAFRLPWKRAQEEDHWHMNSKEDTLDFICLAKEEYLGFSLGQFRGPVEGLVQDEDEELMNHYPVKNPIEAKLKKLEHVYLPEMETYENIASHNLSNESATPSEEEDSGPFSGPLEPLFDGLVEIEDPEGVSLLRLDRWIRVNNL